MSTSKKAINALHQSELYLHFYADTLTKAKTAYECDYIIKYCEINDQSRILDLACGHGRHANELSRRKYAVTGIDINQQFIALARAEASAEDLTTDFIEGDILTIDYQEAFDTVILLYNSLGFFNWSDSQELLKKIGTALKSGGRAFIDIRNRDQILNTLMPYQLTEKNGDLMIDRMFFDPLTGTTTNQRIYYKDGIRYDTPFTMYSYHYQDLEHCLRGTELKVESVLGGWKHETFDAQSKRIILVLKK